MPRDIGVTLLIGLVIAAVISTIFSGGELAGKLTGIWAMLAVMAISIPMYICATASVPLAAAMIFAGLSPGTALVMLVAGPATNAASLTTLWKVLGPKATLTYLGTVAGGALLGGLALDKLFTVTGTSAGMAEMFMLPSWFNSACAIVLIIMVSYSMLPRPPHKENSMTIEADESRAVLKVSGMSCDHCVESIRNALCGQVGVSAVQVDLAGGTATITGAGFNPRSLVETIQGIGFEASELGD